jgi:hypothetical protein
VQNIQGAILRLLRQDSSVVVVQCISKVDIFSSLMVTVDAINANDPNAPTVYRNCRMPSPYSDVEATFHRQTVKLFWRYDSSKHWESETYQIIGVLEPISNHQN